MAYITMVKKIKRNGHPCGKCRDIEARLKREGLYEHIDRVVIADETDPESEGMRLAQIYDVNRAPFFLAANDDGEINTYTVYYRLVREVLKPLNQMEKSMDNLLDAVHELDFV